MLMFLLPMLCYQKMLSSSIMFFILFANIQVSKYFHTQNEPEYFDLTLHFLLCLFLFIMIQRSLISCTLEVLSRLEKQQETTESRAKDMNMIVRKLPEGIMLLKTTTRSMKKLSRDEESRQSS